MPWPKPRFWAILGTMNDAFVWSKIIPLFFYPLPLFLLFLFLITFIVPFRRKDGKKRPVLNWTFRALAVVVWVVSTPWFADRVLGFWEVGRRPLTELPAQSDAALVLGGLSDPVLSKDGHVEFNRSAERITEAFQLYKAGRVKKILISSGSGELLRPDAAEAPSLKLWLVSLGVPEADVLVESKSRNTHENAVFSRELADKNNLKSFVLVTSAWHMRRSEGIFRKEGFDAKGRSFVTWPVDTLQDTRLFPFNAVADPNSLFVVQSVLKEMAGYISYALLNWL